MTACVNLGSFGLQLTMQGAVDEVIYRLKQIYIVCKVCTGCQGLGYRYAGVQNTWDIAQCNESRKMVTDELRKEKLEKRMARAMTSQGTRKKSESAAVI